MKNRILIRLLALIVCFISLGSNAQNRLLLSDTTFTPVQLSQYFEYCNEMVTDTIYNKYEPYNEHYDFVNEKAKIGTKFITVDVYRKIYKRKRDITPTLNEFIIWIEQQKLKNK